MNTSRVSSCSDIAAKRASGDGEHAAVSSSPPWEMRRGARLVTRAVSEVREFPVELDSGARIWVDGVLDDARVGEYRPEVARADGEDTPGGVDSGPTPSDALLGLDIRV